MALKDPNAWINKSVGKPKARPKAKAKPRPQPGTQQRVQPRSQTRAQRGYSPGKVEQKKRTAGPTLRQISRRGAGIPDAPKVKPVRLRIIAGKSRGFTSAEATQIGLRQGKALGIKPADMLRPETRQQVKRLARSKDPLTRRSASQLDKALARAQRDQSRIQGQRAGQQTAKKRTGGAAGYELRRQVSSKGLLSAGSPLLPLQTAWRTGQVAAHVAKATAEDPSQALKSNARFVGASAAGLVTAPLMIATGKVTPRELATAIGADMKAKYGSAYRSHPDWKAFEAEVKKRGALDYALDAATVAAVGGKAVGTLAKMGVAPTKVVKLMNKARPDLRTHMGEGSAVRRQRDETQKALPNILRVLAQQGVDKSRRKAHARELASHEGSTRGRDPLDVDNYFSDAPRRKLGRSQGSGYVPAVNPLSKDEVVMGGVDRLVPGRMARGRSQAAKSLKGNLRVWIQQAQYEALKPVRKAIGKLDKREQLALRYMVGGLITRDEAIRSASKQAKDLHDFKVQGRIDRKMEKPTRAERTEFKLLKDMEQNPERYFTENAEAVAQMMRKSERKSASADAALTPIQAELRRTAPQAMMLGLKQMDGESSIQYAKRVRTEAKKAGMGDAGYFPSERFGTPRRSEFAGGGSRMSHAPKEWTGELFATGREQVHPSIFIEGQARSIKRGIQYPAIQDFIDEVRDKTLSGDRGAPIFQLKQTIEKRGQNPDDFDFYVPGLAKEKFANAPSRGDAEQIESQAMQGAIQGGVHSASELEELAKNPAYKSARAFAVPKGAIDELMPVSNKPAGLVSAGRVANILKSKLSQGMFFANAPWVAANFGSNLLTGGMAGVGPQHMVGGEKWLKTLAPETRAYLAPKLDMAARMDNLYEPQMGAAGGNITGPFQDLWAAYRKTGLGQFAPLRKMTNAWMQAERRVANQPFRAGAFYKFAKNDKRFQGIDLHTGKANEKLNSLLDVNKLPPDQQVPWLKKHAKDLEYVGEQIDEALGNFTDMSKAERSFAGAIMFYPWLRFSLRWTFKTLPANHPILLNIANQLIKLNDDELTTIFGTEPPADMLGNIKMPKGVPIVGGKMIDTRKYVPSGNALLEMFQDQDTASALGVLPPWAGAAFTATSKKNVRSRLSDVNTGGQRSQPGKGPQGYGVGTAARVFGNQLIGANFIAREVAKYRAEGRMGDDSLPFSERPLKYKDPNALAADRQRRKHQEASRQPRNMLAHFLGVDIQSEDVLRRGVQGRKGEKKKSGSTSTDPWALQKKAMQKADPWALQKKAMGQ